MRTKYDKMFERKNQTLLSEHYNKLVDHEDDSDDDVFTLARVNHDLSGGEESDAEEAGPSEPLISSEDLSKRKLKAASTKKGVLKSRPAPTKLVFEDDGTARDFYKAGARAEEEAGGEEARRKFFEQEKERMKEADVVDRQVAREKRRELKRKRKEREREVSTILGLFWFWFVSDLVLGAWDVGYLFVRGVDTGLTTDQATRAAMPACRHVAIRLLKIGS